MARPDFGERIARALQSIVERETEAFASLRPERILIVSGAAVELIHVATLVHESGHSFQGWESQPIEMCELRWPTMEACCSNWSSSMTKAAPSWIDRSSGACLRGNMSQLAAASRKQTIARRIARTISLPSRENGSRSAGRLRT